MRLWEIGREWSCLKICLVRLKKIEVGLAISYSYSVSKSGMPYIECLVVLGDFRERVDA
jgi:hypothetical protein